MKGTRCRVNFNYSSSTLSPYIKHIMLIFNIVAYYLLVLITIEITNVDLYLIPGYLNIAR